MNVYCGEYGECVLCDAQRTSTGNWRAVFGFEDEGGPRTVFEVGRTFWVRKSRRRTTRIVREVWRSREIPAEDPSARRFGGTE